MTSLALALACTTERPPTPVPAEATVREHAVRVEVTASEVRLEAPVLRLAGSPAVVLVGAVHLGDPGYYAAVGRILAGCPTVIREGLAPDPRSVPDEPPPSFAPLGLVRQDEALVDGPGWRVADRTVAEVRADLVAAGAGSELVDAWLGARDDREPIALLATAVDPRTTALARLAVVRGVAVPPPSGPEGDLYWEIVVGSRDRVAVDAIVGASAVGGPVCAVWGADHVRDIEARLVRLGWSAGETEWLAVVAVDLATVGLGPVQVRQLLGR